ncbi:MAG: cupin domain-containing protein [Pseudomonadota bacterium]|nr:cupin domain-containing protein [Pseudomonadota bacterium]
MGAKINLAEKFALFDEQWAPRLAARYNGNEVRLAKLEGDFQWHKHEDTDELFLIVNGELDIEFRDRTETLSSGEIIVIPRGTEHRPRARKGEVQVVIIDAEGTPNTGDEATAYTPVEV